MRIELDLEDFMKKMWNFFKEYKIIAVLIVVVVVVACIFLWALSGVGDWSMWEKPISEITLSDAMICLLIFAFVQSLFN